MSFHGRWQLVIATPIGKQVVDLMLEIRNGQVSGTATQGGEAMQLLKPTIEGDRLRWAQNITRPIKLALTFDVTRDGDTLSGKAKPGILPSVAVIGQRSPLVRDSEPIAAFIIASEQGEDER